MKILVEISLPKPLTMPEGQRLKTTTKFSNQETEGWRDGGRGTGERSARN